MPAIVRTKAHRAFVTLLVDLRTKAELSQRELAKRCGKSQSWIAQLESGTRGIWLAEAPLLAKGLGIPLRDFLNQYADVYETEASRLPAPRTHARIRGMD